MISSPTKPYSIAPLLWRGDGGEAIVHLDLDSFFVSVERLRNPALIGKPVMVGGNSDRGVVAACSYESRVFGVKSAMPMKLARRLCPDAIIVRGDMDVYSKYSNMVTKVIEDRAPLYEKASIDEHYVDISGMDRFFGCLQWTRELKKSITTETGLPVSFGLSVNKTVSKIATDEGKPNGELQVERDRVQPFLDPLSIAKIPGVGQKTFLLLRSMGIGTIETLRNIPPEMLEKVLGEHGISLWAKANGIDNSPVVPYHEQKSISTEMTFDKDTIDVKRINDILTTMIENLCFELRKQKKLTSCIAVKIRYSNFDTHLKQRKIQYTSFDHILLREAKELFKQVYERRMLIRLIGVKLSQLVNGTQQINMFEDTDEKVSLYQATDKIKRRFGENAIMKAVSVRTT